jgi:hypothetical protein
MLRAVLAQQDYNELIGWLAERSLTDIVPAKELEGLVHQKVYVVEITEA